MQTKRRTLALVGRGFALGIALCLMMLLQPTASGLQSGVLTGNLVVAITGQVEIHRHAWSNPRSNSRLSIGEIVQPGDLILLDADEQVTILCADSSVVQLDSMDQAVRCENDPGGPIITWRGNSLMNIQRGDPRRFTRIPYLITPRNTRLLTNTPEIRWSPLANAETYHVQLFNGGVLSWERQGVTETTVTPPPLAPGAYVVCITPLDQAGHSISFPRDPIPQEFEILTEEEIASIEEQRDALTRLSTDNGMETDVVDYQRVIYYTQVRLYTDAIRTLQALLAFNVYEAQTDPLSLPQPTETLVGSPAPYLYLGELYNAVSLPIETRNSFEAALTIAQQINDEEATAMARAHLAELTPDHEPAVAYYREAIEFFENVGDSTMSSLLLARCHSIGDEEECTSR